MAQNSKIEWCNHTANLWWGCSKVHEGCDHCYADSTAKRWGFNIWGEKTFRRPIKSVWKELLKYQRLAEEAGEIHRVFVGSMMDIFEKPKRLQGRSSTTGELRDRFFHEVVPDSPNLLFLLLTKRPSNINKYIPDGWKKNPPRNVMFGTSVSNQKTCKDLIKHLVKVNGQRFLSVEPQISELTLMPWLKEKQIDWVIQGGESGPGKRPFDCDWARKLKIECSKSKVAYFFKQIDKVLPIPRDLMIREFPAVKN